MATEFSNTPKVLEMGEVTGAQDGECTYGS